MKKIIYLFSFIGIVAILALGYFKLYLGNALFDKNAFVSQLEIIQLLQNKQYETLQLMFLKIQDDFEKGTIEDLHLQFAYRAFRNSNPLFEKLFKQWLILMPNSWVARMAYASYENNRAWNFRGGNYVSKTHKKQFSSMAKHFTISKKLLKEILELKPDLLPAYEALIEINKAHGDSKKIKKHYLTALVYHPSSYSIRKVYMDSMAAQWGGDFNEAKNVLSEAKKYHSTNPHLKTLNGYLEYLIADAMRIKNCNTTNVLYDIAILKAIHPTYYVGRSLLHKCNKEYNKALEDINSAMALRAESGWMYYHRGKILYKMKQYQLAIDDFSRSLMFDSHYPALLRARAKAYNKIEYFDSAIVDLQTAQYYGKYNSGIYRLLGYVFYNNKEYDNAARVLKKSIVLDDSKSVTWYKLALTQWKTENCEYLNSLRSYQKKCNLNSDCNKMRIKWKEDSFKFVISNKKCVGYY